MARETAHNVKTDCSSCDRVVARDRHGAVEIEVENLHYMADGQPSCGLAIASAAKESAGRDRRAQFGTGARPAGDDVSSLQTPCQHA